MIRHNLKSLIEGSSRLGLIKIKILKRTKLRLNQKKQNDKSETHILGCSFTSCLGLVSDAVLRHA